MNYFLPHLLLSACLLFASNSSSWSASTQTNATTSPRKSSVAKQRKGHPIPFRGKLSALDPKARTITVGQRTFQVTSETKVQKDGTVARLDSGKVGEQVTGSYVKNEDGKLIARSVYFGVKPDEPAKGKAKNKEKASQTPATQ